MKNWVKVPDDWEVLPVEIANQKNVKYLLEGGLAEKRTLSDGTTQWRMWKKDR